MKNIILITAIFLTLVGCAKPQTDPKEEYRKDYNSYSCHQLHTEFKSITAKLEKENEARMTMNGINTVIGIAGMLSGSGTIQYNKATPTEIEYSDRLIVIKQLALEKKCQNVHFD